MLLNLIKMFLLLNYKLFLIFNQINIFILDLFKMEISLLFNVS